MIGTQQHPAVIEARSWLGTPFALHQRVKGVHGGVDCVGLIEAVGGTLGTMEPARRDYSLWDDDLVAQMDVRMDRTDEALAGDVMAFHCEGSISPRHLAIRTPHGILHTYELVGRVVEHGLSRGWTSRIAGAWRFRVAT